MTNRIRLNKDNYDPNKPHSTSVQGPVSIIDNIKDVHIPSRVKGNNSGTLNDIADISAWEEAIRTGAINAQTHPLFPFTIVKYSAETSYDRNWNPVTLNARGLIFNHETHEIIARPFSKFFNYSEGLTPLELMRGKFIVMDKLDGSLGTSYFGLDGKAYVASSGSFMSEQAQHATTLLQNKYDGKWKMDRETTYLWEIIYPSNRIVVDYGQTNDLFLIGAINRTTGESIPLNEVKEWKWNRAEQYEFSSLDEVVAHSDRTNKEGFIVHFTETDTRVKLKHEEYVKIHRLVTGVNERTLWSMLKEEADFKDMLVHMPEEFINYVDTTTKNLVDKHAKETKNLEDEYKSVLSILPKDYTQKDFALKVQEVLQASSRPAAFMLHKSGGDPQSIKELVWERIKPEFQQSGWQGSAE